MRSEPSSGLGPRDEGDRGRARLRAVVHPGRHASSPPVEVPHRGLFGGLGDGFGIISRRNEHKNLPARLCGWDSIGLAEEMVCE